MSDYRACPFCGAEGEAGVVETIEWHGRPIFVGLCRVCALVYQLNPLSSAELRDYYAEHSVYQESGPGSRQASVNDARHKFMDSLLGDVARECAHRPTILDVGCGYGDFLATVPDSWTRHGVELSADRVRHAKDAFGLDVIEGDIYAYDGPLESVNVITVNAVLEHILDPVPFLRYAWRLLAPGGRIVISVPNLLNPMIAASNFFTVEHVTYFTGSTLLGLLERSGLLVERLGTQTPDYPDIAAVASVGEFSTRSEYFNHGAEEVLYHGKGLPSCKAPRFAVKAYRERRRDLMLPVICKLIALDHDIKSCGLAVYGAGEHTRQLAAVFPPLGSVQVFIDGDERKWGQPFLGGTVYPPKASSLRGITKVLLSSRPYEGEMRRRLMGVVEPGVEVIGLYG